ncbi:prohead protease/major capsid protein fusion protein [Citromicrobium bathyomarinum]
MTMAVPNSPPSAMPAPVEPFAAEQVRRAPLSASSYNAETRTFEADLATATPVRRGGFLEVLEISAGAIDLGRVASGLAPLLDTHNAYELKSVLGRITGTRIENGKLVATFALAETDAARAAEGMVERGEIKGISVGYKVTEWRHDRGSDGQPDTYTATRWELLEASLVPVPADAATGVRSFPKEAHMPEQNPQPDTGVSTPATTRFDADEAVAFVKVARSFGDAAEHKAEELVRGNAAGEYSAQAARDAFMRFAGEQQQARTAGVRAGPIAFAGGSFDDPAFFRDAAVEAIAAKLSRRKVEGPGAELRGLSVVDICRSGLQRAGHRDTHRMNAETVIRAASQPDGHNWFGQRDVTTQGLMSTSMLPGLLQSAGERHLVEVYNAVASPLKAISTERSAKDFRAITAMQTTGVGKLRKVNEAGEFQNSTLSESAETYSVHTYGEIVGLTRQAIVNDDLAAFANMLSILARAAAVTEGELFANKLVENPDLSDGHALFSEEHANLAASGGAPSVATLSEARLAMRSHRDTTSDTPLSPVPRYIAISPALETTVDQLLASITANTVAEVNPFSGKLTPIVDPWLTGNAWYLIADPATAPVLEHAYLDGMSEPYLDQQEGWRVDGTEWKVRLDVGVGVVDFRGAFKNPGA